MCAAPTSNEVQGSAPTFPLLNTEINIATHFFIWTRTFPTVAFVSSSSYLYLSLMELNLNMMRLETGESLANEPRR